MTSLKPSRRRSAPDRLPSIIAFRVDEPAAKALAERATRLGVSVHDVARDLVFQGLNQPDQRSELRTSLLVLHEVMTLLRGDVASVAEVLLVTAGKVKRDDAHDWVEQHLARACSRSQTR